MKRTLRTAVMVFAALWLALAMELVPALGVRREAYAITYAVASEYDGLSRDIITNCVSFAKYKVPSLPNGSTSNSKYSIINSHTAKAGSIAIYSYQHVSYVESVNGGTLVTLNGGFRETLPDGTAGDFTGHIERIAGTESELNIIGYYDPNGGVSVYGGFDGIQCLDGKLRVYGWAKDGNYPNAQIDVHVYVGGPAGSGAPCYPIKANKTRSDVGACAFDETFLVGPYGSQEVYVYGIAADGSGNNAQIGSSKTVNLNSVHGAVDSCTGGAGTIRVYGWAKDKKYPNTPVDVHIYVGGPAGTGAAEVVKANAVRSDVGACAFDVTFETALRGSQQVYVYALHADGAADNPLIGSKAVTIQEPANSTRSISDATITLSKTSYTYTGSSIKPSVTVTYGGKTLVSGVDYNVSYSNNTNAGTASVTVTGKGNYSGTKGATFSIAKATPTISVSDNSVAYGKSVDLAASVSPSCVGLSYESSDTSTVTVSPAGVVEGVRVGSATVTISCPTTNNYKTSSKTVKITVTKAANTLVAEAAKTSVTVKYSKVKTKARVLASNVKFINKGQGTLRYANVSKKAAAKKFKVNAKTGKVTVPKGTKKGTYTIKVKVTAAGNANYTAGTKTITYKVVVK